MSIYYASELLTVRLGDCLRVLPGLAGSSVDAVVEKISEQLTHHPGWDFGREIGASPGHGRPRRYGSGAAMKASQSPGPAPPGAETGQARWASDQLIGIREIREIFKLGRTAAYELTHRAEFPEPVVVSARCYRWWASEVSAFAASLHRKPAVHAEQSGRPRRTPGPNIPHTAASPRRITGKIRAARTRRNAP